MGDGEINIYSNGQYMDYYRSGESFLKASERCFGERNGEKFTILKSSENGAEYLQLPVPTVVNASFACELFFKALILKAGLNIPKGRNGHNLLQLYKVLPNDIQEKISNFCFHHSTKTQFENFLSNHAEDFVNIRYFIENNGFSNMSPMLIYALAFNLGQITKSILSSGEMS